VRADLDQVADLVSGDARPGGWLDTQTGDCLSENDRAAMDEEFRPDVEDEHRWVWLNCTGPQSRWRDRYEFAQALRPGPLRDSLLVALEWSGAFRRFARVLDREPELLAEWRAFSAERDRGRARAALLREGYLPAPP
jgi:hypothetical protein